MSSSASNGAKEFESALPELYRARGGGGENATATSLSVSTKKTPRNCRSFWGRFWSCRSTGGKARQSGTASRATYHGRHWSRYGVRFPYRTHPSLRSTIRYERRPDYWGRLAQRQCPGKNNFDSITYSFFGRRDVEFEAFRSGNVDYWSKIRPCAGVTGFDFRPRRKER